LEGTLGRRIGFSLTNEFWFLVEDGGNEYKYVSLDSNIMILKGGGYNIKETGRRMSGK
jgi:hypothetical protein